MAYCLLYKESVAQDLETIPEKKLKRVVQRMQSLGIAPHGKGTMQLQVSDGIYRVRQGDYRIIYTVNNKDVTIVDIKVGHRKEVHAR